MALVSVTDLLREAHEQRVGYFQASILYQGMKSGRLNYQSNPAGQGRLIDLDEGLAFLRKKEHERVNGKVSDALAKKYLAIAADPDAYRRKVDRKLLLAQRAKDNLEPTIIKAQTYVSEQQPIPTPPAPGF